MAKLGRKNHWGRKTFPRPLMTYLTSEDAAAVRHAAAREGIGAAAWLRRLLKAEISRLAARDQLAAG
jgi:hypothetical protein